MEFYSKYSTLCVLLSARQRQCSSGLSDSWGTPIHDRRSSLSLLASETARLVVSRKKRAYLGSIKGRTVFFLTLLLQRVQRDAFCSCSQVTRSIEAG